MELSAKQVLKLREETPSCSDIIHFNNAGAALMPGPVHRAIIEHLLREIEIGSYEAEQEAKSSIEDFYHSVAGLIGAVASEISWIENATRAWSMAFHALRLGEGDRVIIHESEYSSNYLSILHYARRFGIEVDVIGSDSFGQVDLEALRRTISSKTRAIAVGHIPSHNGMISPVVEIGRIASEFGVLFMLDAAQSVGQLNLDVKKIGCHILVAPGRKYLRGPRGSGFLYVSNKTLPYLDPPFVDLHSAKLTDQGEINFAADGKRFECWESHVAGKIGLDAAIRYTLSIGMESIEDRVCSLAERLRQSIDPINGVQICDRGSEKSGIVSFVVAGTSARHVKEHLASHGVNVSLSTREHAPLDFDRHRLPDIVRASPHYYNTDGEIKRFTSLLEDLQATTPKW